MNNAWAKRRWYDFRAGHGVYLIFILSFSNFILIFHRLLIERIEFLNEVFSDLVMFVVIFLLFYIPVATLIGAWHRKTQLKVDTEIWLRQSPLLAKVFRILIDMQTKKVTEKEIENMRELLKQIEEGKGQSKNV